MVALAPRRGADALHVRAGIGLGHGDGNDLLAGDDIGQVLVLLRLAAGIGDVDRGHVGMDQRGDRDAGEGRAAQFLGQHDSRHRVHLGATIIGGVADTEEAELAHLAQHVARNETVLLPLHGMRLDLGLDEAADLVAQRLMLLGEVRRAARAFRDNLSA